MYFENIEIDGEVLLKIPIHYPSAHAPHDEQLQNQTETEKEATSTTLEKETAPSVQPPERKTIKIIRKINYNRTPIPDWKHACHWAVIKTNLDAPIPTYKVINVQKIIGRTEITRGTKLKTDPLRRTHTAEVVEIFPTQAKACDYVRLMFYRYDRKRPLPSLKDLKPNLLPPQKVLRKDSIDSSDDDSSDEDEDDTNNDDLDKEGREVEETFGLIRSFFNEPAPEFIAPSAVRELKEKSKTIQDFGIRLANVVFTDVENQRFMKERDPTKITWMRRTIAQQYPLMEEAAEKRLWNDCIKAINQNVLDMQRKKVKIEQQPNTRKLIRL